MAINPRDKYQRGDRGPSLRAIAKPLAGHGGDPGDLLRVAVFESLPVLIAERLARLGP